MEILRSVLPGSVLVTARKGTFGHGMGAGGGWELTAQYLASAGGGAAAGNSGFPLSAPLARS